MTDDAEVPESADLYQLPPGEFVAARNQLAKALRADGRRDDATRVAKLRRPSVTAWALNLSARHDPELVEAAIAAGADLRRATEAAIAGDRAALRDAQLAQRLAVDRAVDAAVVRLRDAGATENDQVRRRLADTLRAAASDAAVAAHLRAGRLEDDHGAAGFGLELADLPDATKPDATHPDATHREDAERQRRRAEMEETVARLADRAAELSEAARAAEATAARARRHADDAEAALEAARGELDGSGLPD